jgi:hypothetical protein
MKPTKVVVTTPYSFTIRKKSQPTIKSSVRSGIIMARKLADLMDVDVSNVQDNFVLMYDAADQKYRAYDPDEVLSNSVNGGLPQNFMDYLNDTLNPQSLYDAINQIYEYINSLTLGQLSNVKESVDSAGDTFIIRYDETSGKYEAVDPDEILSSAVDESGLPASFIAYLNEVLIPESLSQALEELQNDLQNLTLGDLANVYDATVLDKYVIMYEAATARYLTVNPDEVLKATVEENTEPGLPEEFLQQLDDDLDNRIDSDAGFF